MASKIEEKKSKQYNKQFLIITIASFIIMTLMVYGSAISSYEYALTSERGQIQANNTQQEILEKAKTITATDIFLNNYLISLPLILPAFGFIYFGRVLINTGLTIGVLAYSFDVPPSIYLFRAYLPIGFIETLAYSILATEGIMIVHSLIKENFRARIKQKTWKAILTHFLLLAFGAVLEAFIIHS